LVNFGGVSDRLRLLLLHGFPMLHEVLQHSPEHIIGFDNTAHLKIVLDNEAGTV
jgi:hypothetical protein